MFEWPKESFLDSAADKAVALFDLTVGLRVSHQGVAYVDSQVFTEFLELLGGEVRPIVRDDAVWYSKVVDNRLEELDSAGS